MTQPDLASAPIAHEGDSELVEAQLERPQPRVQFRSSLTERQAKVLSDLRRTIRMLVREPQEGV